MTSTRETYQHPEYLVETNWLAQNLDLENLRVFDCTVNVVPNPDLELAKKIPFIYQTNLSDFEKSHIPYAGYIDIANMLSDVSSALPLMMPPEKQFVDVMSKFGVTQESRIILYSATEQNWATRLWWMLRSFGFTNAAVLNGGWGKWLAEARPVSDSACRYKTGEFIAQSDPNLFVDKDQVLSAIGKNNVRIINALPEPMYTGTSPFAFGRKGRITGSVNIPFISLLDPDTGTYLPADKLQDLFNTVDVENAERLITYCGGGVAASNDAFVLALLGYDNVSVYDGSMLEWGNDTSLPMDVD